ncbi:hypothetical protein RM543_04365 [Roseicyclus sp. F158]|uniref:Sulfotransferase family protein n=1 Tax=Tropicimonas omnivorans TaxID=3075590 RepID=A0ABU3DDY1_9RHOB|nr:hypothetical protein [Roseicyclus sp. F158]MDT0681909.1 hypothetical protein [Roseicyclus sp. F158]
MTSRYDSVFVSSLGHSGSTLLDFLVGTGGHSVSLGEWKCVWQRPRAEVTAQTCSCGASALDCPFWGVLIPRLPEGRSRGPANDVLHDTFAELFPGRIMVDSSKDANHLIEHVDRRRTLVLHVSKDVRSWTCRWMDRPNRAGKRKGGLTLMREWHRRETAAVSRTRGMVDGTDWMQILYDDLVLGIEAEAERINRRAGVDLIDTSVPFTSGEHHILYGNSMKGRTDGRIRYDARWLGRSDWLVPYLLLPRVRRYNEVLRRGEAPGQGD